MRHTTDAPCSQEMYEIGYGATGPHPNCLDNLTTSLARFGVTACPAATCNDGKLLPLGADIDMG